MINIDYISNEYIHLNLSKICRQPKVLFYVQQIFVYFSKSSGSNLIFPRFMKPRFHSTQLLFSQSHGYLQERTCCYLRRGPRWSPSQHHDPNGSPTYNTAEKDKYLNILTTERFGEIWAVVWYTTYHVAVVSPSHNSHPQPHPIHSDLCDSI